MGIRIATAGIHHESNTFSAIPADLPRFEEGGIKRREGIRESYSESHSTLAGFLEGDALDDVEVAPILYASVNPSGPLTRSAYLFLINEILAELEREGPWDGVLLAQHGAAVGDGILDLDGVIVEQIRASVGPTVPIGVAIDMHANVSSRLVDHTDVLVAYQTNPHVDPRIRARHCTDMLLATIRGDHAPATVLVPIPVALHIAVQDTSTGAIADLLDVTRTVESEYGLLSASLVEGFPYADVPQMGMSVITIADGDTKAATEAAELIATAVWNRRHDLTTRLPIPADALEESAATTEPTLVLDVGDNIGGGSTGDSTVLLHQAKRLRIGGLFQTLYDPASVTACLQAGVRPKVKLEVGGRLPGSPAPPFPVRGGVVGSSNGLYEDPTVTHGGFRYFDAGPCLVVETEDGHTILLTSKLVPNTSLQQLVHIGLDPRTFSILIGKGVNAPKAAYQPIVDRMIYADTPGVTAGNLEHLDYQNRPPCFPFEDFDWTPTAHVSARASQYEVRP
jgi:microcystin degradation protein MlrC